ncbi:hypothetical protein [Acinetobacter calcoaceticus]|uniref:Archaellum component FlaC n=1 Tax=Acinetobacter calcoaceticus TaxID=471 RepID=A0ABD5APT7_ACICA|nr:hypothetical protein [Acinetobacter calcoaceticus]MDP9804534.1 archaellum component FlaC [Acinetobacter calcoaceticus]
MFFNNEESKHLFFCKKFAEQLENYYPSTIHQININNGEVVKGNCYSIFDTLKTIIFRIETFLKSFIGTDLNNNTVRIIKDYFDTFYSSTSVTKSQINDKNAKIILRSYIWDFYKFITDFFANKAYIGVVNNKDALDEIEFIVDEVCNLNESYGLDLTKNSTNNRLYDRVVLLEEQLKKLTNEVNFNSNQISETVDGFVLKKEEDFDKQLNDLIDTLRSSLNSIHNKYENEIKGKVENLDTLVNQTDQDFKSTFNDYNQLKGLVNIKGEMLITDHYKNRAFWERITYWVMTVGTFLIIILSICLALNGLDEYKEKTDIPVTALIEKYKDQPIEKVEKIYSAAQENALIYLILRLIFSVLLFSSIIYTSRVAYRAYVHMRHSENMMLKLATLRPFINQLNEDERNQIHKDLVPDYFGKDAGMVDSANEKFKDLPANVSAVAMKAIEQISGGGNNLSKTESITKKDSA